MAAKRVKSGAAREGEERSEDLLLDIEERTPPYSTVGGTAPSFPLSMHI
jgi:hypothetical protein